MAIPKTPKPTPTPPIVRPDVIERQLAAKKPKPVPAPSGMDFSKLPAVKGTTWNKNTLQEWAIQANMSDQEAYNFWANFDKNTKALSESFAAEAKAKVRPKNQISSAGALLNTLNTTAAFTSGFLDKAIEQSQGKTPQKNPLDALNEAIGSGNQNATAWMRGERVKDTASILVDRFGWDAKNGWTGVAGFVGDAVLDPLNFIPAKTILSVAKGAIKAADKGVSAAKLIGLGEESAAKVAAKNIELSSEKQITKRTEDYVAKLNEQQIAKTGKELSPEEIKTALKTDAAQIAIGNVKPATIIRGANKLPLNLTKLPGAAGEKIAATAAKIENKYVFQTTKLTKAELAARSNIDALKATTAAALEAGRKSFMASILSDQAMKSAQKYMRKDRKMVWAPTIKGTTGEVLTPGTIIRNLTKTEPVVRTKIVQSPDGKEFIVQSGNKVELARAATYEEAQKLAKQAQVPISASQLSKKDIADLFPSKPDLQTVTTKEAVKLTTKLPENSVVKKILNDVTKESKAAGYDSFEGLIAGLNNGDNISADNMSKVLNALDPERRIVPSAMKGENVTQPDYLRQVLVSKEAQNYLDQLNRLEKAENFESIVGVKGLGFAEETAIYVDALRNPGKIPTDYQDALMQAAVKDVKTAQTAAAAAERFVTTHSARSRNLAEDGAKIAAESRNLRIDRIQEKATYGKEISDFGQLVEFSNEAGRLSENSEAVLAEEFNSVFESVAIARAAGNSRTEWVKEAKDLEVKGGDMYNPQNPAGTKKQLAGQHDEFADYMYRRVMETSDALSDMLLAGNVRIQNSKYRNDEDFLKAFKQFGDKMRVADVQHFVYVNIADVFKTFEKLGYKQLLKDAFFPFAPGDAYQNSSFLWQNLTDGVRASLEMADKGKAFNIAELETRLLERFRPSKQAPAERVAEMRDLANKIATALTDPRVTAELKKIHTTKTMGIVNDYIYTTKNVIASIAESSRNIWLAKIMSGDSTRTDKVKTLRKAFRELLSAIDIFKIDAGPVAESIARSYAAAFMRGTDEGLKDVVDEAVKAELDALAKDFVKLYEVEKAQTAARLGERSGAHALQPTKQKAENILVRRENAYETHMLKRDEIFQSGDETLKADWLTTYSKLQKELDKARITAASKGVETRNWSLIRNEWVAANNYDAVQEAEDVANTFIETIPVDSPAILPQKLLPTNEKTQKEVNAAQVEIQKGKIADAADEADSFLEQGVFAREGRSDIEEVIRAVEHAETKPLIDATSLPDIKVHTIAGDYKTNRKNSYNPMLTETEKAAGFTRWGGATYIKDTWGGVYGSGYDQMQFLHVNAQNAMDVSSKFATYLRSVAAKWNGLDNKAFGAAWNALRSGKTEIKSQNAAVQGVFGDIKPIMQLIFGDDANNELINSGISLSDVVHEMTRIGLTSEKGFPSAHAVRDMTTQQFKDALPLGSRPKSVEANTAGAAQWNKNKKALEKADFNEFEVLANIAHAVQMVKFKKGMMDDFFIRNNYNYYGLTRAEAQSGLHGEWVKPRVIGGKKYDETYSQYIPEDALVLKDAWESFGAVLREANALYNRAPNPIWLKLMMDVNGVIKANQTAFVPGHQLTNIMGDTSIAINVGVTNPAWWGTGVRLANSHALELATGDWIGETVATAGAGVLRQAQAGVSKAVSKIYKDPTKLDRGIDKIEAQFRDLFRTANSKTRAYEGTDATVAHEPATDTWVVKNSRGEVVERVTSEKDAKRLAQLRGNKTTGVIIYKNGKPVRVNFSDQDMIQLMRQNGIILSNMLANDYQDLANYLENAKANDKQGQFFRKAGARIAVSYHRALKVPGDLIAWHGNIPRIAHAMKVIQSRSWGSIEDAMAEAARVVGKYHPSPTTLRSSERRYARAVIGYYTWLKSMHMTMLDMLLTRPALVTLPSKAMKEYSETQGFKPESIGSPYGNQQSVAPWFRNSPVGMLVGKPENAYIVKPPFAQTQVLNTFNFTWDFTKTPDEAVWQGVLTTAPQTIGKMLGPTQKRVIEVLTKVDPDTGLPSQVKDSRSAFDAIAGDFSIFQLLKGLGIYTPKNKDPLLNKTPVTPAEQRSAEINWWTRIGLTPLYTPGSVKGANMDNAAVMKRLQKLLQQQQTPIDESQYNQFVQDYIRNLEQGK